MYIKRLLMLSIVWLEYTPIFCHFKIIQQPIKDNSFCISALVEYSKDTKKYGLLRAFCDVIVKASNNSKHELQTTLQTIFQALQALILLTKEEESVAITVYKGSLDQQPISNYTMSFFITVLFHSKDTVNSSQDAYLIDEYLTALSKDKECSIDSIETLVQSLYLHSIKIETSVIIINKMSWSTV